MAGCLGPKALEEPSEGGGRWEVLFLHASFSGLPHTPGAPLPLQLPPSGFWSQETYRTWGPWEQSRVPDSTELPMR